LDLQTLTTTKMSQNWELIAYQQVAAAEVERHPFAVRGGRLDRDPRQSTPDAAGARLRTRAGP
jgi:hypothetical protein